MVSWCRFSQQNPSIEPVLQVSFHPLQSFSNALRAADVASGPLSVVRGWVIWELLEGQRGTGTG